MSDPVTSAEIEDVLSSIRKLVSQDTSAPHEPELQDDALVLTENQRVADDEGDDSESVTTDTADMRKQAASAVRTELERAIEELEATMGIDAQHEQREPDTLETVADPEDEPDDEQTSEDASFEDEGVQEFASEEANDTALELKSDDEQETLDDVSSLNTDEFSFVRRADITDNDDEEAQDDIDWDAPVGHAMEGQPPDPEEEEVQEQTADERSVLEAIKIVSDASSASEQGYDEAYEGDVLKDAELEFDDDTPEVDEIVEPEVTVEKPLSEEPPTDEALTEELPNAELHTEEPSIKDLSEAEEPSTIRAADLAIDEDLLRDLVADIVRSELQGELGERITRNVRKLVRREINRALAGQDLI